MEAAGENEGADGDDSAENGGRRALASPPAPAAPAPAPIWEKDDDDDDEDEEREEDCAAGDECACARPAAAGAGRGRGAGRMSASKCWRKEAVERSNACSKDAGGSAPAKAANEELTLAVPRECAIVAEAGVRTNGGRCVRAGGQCSSTSHRLIASVRTAHAQEALRAGAGLGADAAAESRPEAVRGARASSSACLTTA